MNFPNDVDGDVFRRLQNDSFDFSKVWEIDFRSWPLTKDIQNEIKDLYPNCKFYDPDEEDIENGDLVGFA